MARARAIIAAVLAIAMCGVLLVIFHRDHPIRDWVVWPYAIAFALASLHAAACMSCGHAILLRIIRRTLPLAEHAALAYGTGAFVFLYLLWIIGFLGLLKPFAVFGLPVALIAAGLRPTLRTLSRLRRLRSALSGRGPRAPRITPVPLLLGSAALFVVFARELTTSGIGYDAGWYHLPIAETYAATGRIGPFSEGWFLGAYPHSGSVLYAWAYVASKRTALALLTSGFLEQTAMLAAVFGIVPLTRALIPRGRHVPWAWAAMAAIPGLYLYPPQREAEWIAAQFAPALALLTLRAFRDLDRRLMVLWAATVSGVVLAKYSAISLLVFPFVAILVGATLLLVRPRNAGERRRVLATLGLTAVIGLVGTAPQWLRNVVFYGDPMYPLFVERLHGHPWTGTASEYLHGFWRETQVWQPTKGKALSETLHALFTFSFETHEYGNYNAGHPWFGSLFTLTLPILVFVPNGRRALWLHLGVLGGIAVWFNLHHQDRYLITLAPWMAAVSAATAILLVKSAPWSRAVVAAAAIAQIAWGIPVAARQIPFEAMRAAFATNTYDEWEDREMAGWASNVKLDHSLPHDAKLLFHDDNVKVGIRRPTVSDAQGFQGGISYVDLATDARVYDALRALGVTHLYANGKVWGVDTMGGDLVFYSFYLRFAESVSGSGAKRMPRSRPPDVAPESRLALLCVCGASRESPGLYRVIDLNRPASGSTRRRVPKPIAPLASDASPEDAQALLDRAEFLVLGKCAKTINDLGPKKQFKRLATAEKLVYWIHRTP